MDIKSREEILLQRNASIGNLSTESRSQSISPSRIPRPRCPSAEDERPQMEAKKATKKKKINLAILNQKKKEMGTSDLLKTLDEYKKDNTRLADEIRGLTREKDHIQAQLARKVKVEEKMRHELESNALKMREAENEANMFRNMCERQEREIKQRDASTKSDTVRLARQEEQLQKLKTDLFKSQEANASLREELRNLKEMHQKHTNLKDKQIEQLLDGFQKQMQLIDVLRRQKLHLEAAHILQYTEDEFLQTLDWKPFGHSEESNGKMVNPSG